VLNPSNESPRHKGRDMLTAMKPCRSGFFFPLLCLTAHFMVVSVHGQKETPLVPLADTQPLSANVSRLAQAFEFLGTPLDEPTAKALSAAAQARDAMRIQELLDPQVLFVVTINPESRVKVQRGAAKAILQQAGFTPVLVKIINQSTTTKELRIVSPQAG